MKRNLISFFLFFLFFGVFVNSEYSQEQGLIIWEIEDDKNFNSELIKSSPFILIGTLDGKMYDKKKNLIFIFFFNSFYLF